MAKVERSGERGKTGTIANMKKRQAYEVNPNHMPWVAGTNPSPLKKAHTTKMHGNKFIVFYYIFPLFPLNSNSLYSKLFFLKENDLLT